jgi:hypothetical protein
VIVHPAGRHLRRRRPRAPPTTRASSSPSIALLWDQAFANRRFAPAEIDQLAIGVGLAMARFRADVAGPCVAEVEADQAELARFGVNATPSFFINGRYLAGAQPLASFAALVDEELAKAEAAVSRGVKPARYYQQEIVGKGLTGLAIAPAHGATP